MIPKRHRAAVVEPSYYQMVACRRARKFLRKAAAAVAIDTLDHQQVAGFIDGTGPFASNVHSADGHDGGDDGVDFVRRPTHLPSQQILSNLSSCPTQQALG